MPPNVLGDRSRRIRELTTLVEQRWGFEEDDVKLFVERLANRGLCPEVQAESLRYKLLGGLACRRACYGVVKAIMEGGAKGCEIIVSGNLRAQRAKAMKFKEGYMVKSGHVGQMYVTKAVRHVMMRQGVLGIRLPSQMPLKWEHKSQKTSGISPTHHVGFAGMHRPRCPRPQNIVSDQPTCSTQALRAHTIGIM